MSSPASDISIKLEVLRMAREIVNNEYVDKRAQDHNKWLSDSEKLSIRGIKVPYPDIPPYPDESLVILKAKTLLSFLGSERAEEHPAEAKTQEYTEVKKQPEPQKPQVVQVEKVEVEEVPEQNSKQKSTSVRSNEDLLMEHASKRVPSYDPENEPTSSSRMISMLLSQLEDLKKLRK